MVILLDYSQTTAKWENIFMSFMFSKESGSSLKDETFIFWELFVSFAKSNLAGPIDAVWSFVSDSTPSVR